MRNRWPSANYIGQSAKIKSLICIYLPMTLSRYSAEKGIYLRRNTSVNLVQAENTI